MQGKARHGAQLQFPQDSQLGGGNFCTNGASPPAHALPSGTVVAALPPFHAVKVTQESMETHTELGEARLLLAVVG